MTFRITKRKPPELGVTPGVNNSALVMLRCRGDGTWTIVELCGTCQALSFLVVKHLRYVIWILYLDLNLTELPAVRLILGPAMDKNSNAGI